MALTLFNSKAQLDLSVIDPAEVALLNDAAQLALKNLIEAAKTKEAATDRWLRAQAAVQAAEAEQKISLAEHIRANPPMTQQAAHAQAVAAYNSSH